MNYDEQKRKDFWDKLDEKIHKNTDNKILHILCIDNNGQIGSKEKTKNIGRHTISKNNEKGNGVSLSKRLKKWGMRAMNTTKEKSKNKNKEKEELVTWISSDKKTQRQIDYILVNNHKVNWVDKVYTSEHTAKR